MKNAQAVRELLEKAKSIHKSERRRLERIQDVLAGDGPLNNKIYKVLGQYPEFSRLDTSDRPLEEVQNDALIQEIICACLWAAPDNTKDLFVGIKVRLPGIAPGLSTPEFVRGTISGLMIAISSKDLAIDMGWEANPQSEVDLEVNFVDLVRKILAIPDINPFDPKMSGQFSNTMAKFVDLSKRSKLRLLTIKKLLTLLDTLEPKVFRHSMVSTERTFAAQFRGELVRKTTRLFSDEQLLRILARNFFPSEIEQ